MGAVIKSIDPRDIILLTLGAIVLCVLAISGAVGKDVAQNALLVYLGIIGGAVTGSISRPPVTTIPPAG
jgi:hypothetical protein